MNGGGGGEDLVHETDRAIHSAPPSRRLETRGTLVGWLSRCPSPERGAVPSAFHLGYGIRMREKENSPCADQLAQLNIELVDDGRSKQGVAKRSS